MIYLRAPKSWWIASLICRTKPKKEQWTELKTKNWDARKKRSSHKVCGVSPQAGRESMVGKICERGRFWAGSERVRELWMVRVVSQQRKKSEIERLGSDWQRVGSWFLRQGEAYRKEQSVIRNEDDVGGQARFGLSYWLGVCIMSIYGD